MGAAFVEVLPVGKFHGVGPVTADKMNRLGIYPRRSRRQSLAFLQRHFGKSGLGITPSPMARTTVRSCRTARAVVADHTPIQPFRW